MAVSRPRQVTLAKMREGVGVSGAMNGINTVFTTTDKFRHEPPRLTVSVYYNGQRLLINDDFTVSESGGPSTGFDTVTLLFAPRSGDKIWVDYVVLS